MSAGCEAVCEGSTRAFIGRAYLPCVSALLLMAVIGCAHHLQRRYNDNGPRPTTGNRAQRRGRNKRGVGTGRSATRPTVLEATVGTRASLFGLSVLAISALVLIVNLTVPPDSKCRVTCRSHKLDAEDVRYYQPAADTTGQPLLLPSAQFNITTSPEHWPPVTGPDEVISGDCMGTCGVCLPNDPTSYLRAVFHTVNQLCPIKNSF